MLRRKAFSRSSHFLHWSSNVYSYINDPRWRVLFLVKDRAWLRTASQATVFTLPLPAPGSTASFRKCMCPTKSFFYKCKTTREVQFYIVRKTSMARIIDAQQMTWMKEHGVMVTTLDMDRFCSVFFFFMQVFSIYICYSRSFYVLIIAKLEKLLFFKWSFQKYDWVF